MSIAFHRTVCFSLLALAACCCFAAVGEDLPAFTDNGAWCWFSDPRAIYDATLRPQIVTGWVANDGSIVAGALDLHTGTVTTSTLYSQLEYDDHNNPVFLVRPDGHLLAFYTKHGKDSIYLSVSKAPGSIAAWEPPVAFNPNDPEAVARYKDNRYTYANPFLLSDEGNRIYCFGRWSGFKPNMTWSDDGGATWAPARVIVFREPFEGRNRPYVKYFSDGERRIHMLFTDGHPNIEPTNSVYYAYYEAGAFHHADDTHIAALDALPFEPREASIVYDATQTGARAWVWDLAVTPDGRPVAVYTRMPSETDHRYHYAVFDRTRWIDHEICAAGKWFPHTPDGATEREPWYSAGITLDPNRPDTVYLARPAGGAGAPAPAESERIEIERWTTPDHGATWTRRAVTANSEYDQVRPYVPRGLPQDGPEVVLWMQIRRYTHFTDYDAGIRYTLSHSPQD